MKNLVVVAVCTVSLSGCSLPVGVSTWSEDGWSVLATQKSILDHGISYVSGEDCALWRMFTEHDVCQQDDAETVLADADTDQQYPAGYADDALADYRSLTQGEGAVAYEVDTEGGEDTGSPGEPVVIAALGDASGYLPRGGQPWYLQNKNAEYLSLMPKDFYSRNKPMSVAEPVSVRADALPVQSVVASGQTSTPSIDIEFDGVSTIAATPQIVTVARSEADNTLAGRAPITDSGNTFDAVPGQYLVVGSFSVPENADRYAASYSNLAAHVHQTRVDGTTVYRVVIGPYLDGERVGLSAAIADAGITSTWKLRVRDGSSITAWLPYDASEVAAIPAMPRS